MFDLLWLILKRKSVVRITTRSQELDDLLGGTISLDPSYPASPAQQPMRQWGKDKLLLITSY
jgi:hypothetical protein